MNSSSNRPTGSSHSRTAGAGDSAFGSFAVLDKLGEGGMGAVYLAEDSKLKRRVAIKTMRPELASDRVNRDRFEREARAAAAVEHDNLVPILHVGEAADGTPYIVMPFLKGEPLDARLKREPVSPLWLLLKVAREVSEGLAAAHAAGLVHRDIKPANIWLEGDPKADDPAQQVKRCKILDFGLARTVERDDAHITASGAILGTPAYMAPEQARGEPVDARADLWSLGVMLYRMATGQPPFRGPNAMAVLCAVLADAPRPVREAAPHVPAPLADLIGRLMSKDPADRPRSAAAVVAAAAERGRSARPAQNPQPTPAANPWEEMSATEADELTPRAAPPEGRRGLWLVAGLAAVLVALVVVLAVVVLRVETAEGTLVVEISDPDVETRVKNGRLVLYGPDGKERYTLSPGERNQKIEAGKYAVRVEGADGLALETSEFTLKKNGRVTVRVTLAPPPPVAKKPEPDRKAALYALSIRGRVRVNDGTDDITVPADLPKEPFQLTGIDFAENAQLSNAEMAVFGECKSLKRVNLFKTATTDAGVAHLRHSTGLTSLILTNTQVGDAGVAHFKDCKELADLHLFGTRVTDTGVANFKDCKKLVTLHLGLMPTTDAALSHFGECDKLVEVNLGSGPYTDAGLKHLESLKGVRDIYLQGTRVTATGVASAAKALPQCRIHWNGGVFGPQKK